MPDAQAGRTLMKNLYLITTFLLLMIPGCTNDSVTGIEDESLLTAEINDHELQKTPVLVPIKGNYSGSGSIDAERTDCPAGTVPISGEGTGTASHSGKIHVNFSHCSYFLADPENPTYTDGWGQLISANGDTIYGSYFGNLTGPDSFVDYNTIIGGSGRFDGAEGHFIEYGTAVFTPEGFDFNIYFEGEISTVGSQKRQK